MQNLIKTKFYQFNQNNSGGYFITDEENGISEVVIIESDTAKRAYEKLQEIGEKVDSFNDYCECCGERWSNWLDDEEGDEIPSYYGNPISQARKGIFDKNIFVHYLDGKFEKFILK